MWCCNHDHIAIARVHPLHSDECRLSARWLPTLRPISQPTWTVIPRVKASAVHTHHYHLLLLLCSNADTRFIVPCTEGGRLSRPIGTVVGCAACAQCCKPISQWLWW